MLQILNRAAKNNISPMTVSTTHAKNKDLSPQKEDLFKALD